MITPAPRAHVPLPLFVAGLVFPFTVTLIVAVGSLTVPVSVGDVLLIVDALEETVGAVRSMTSTLLATLLPTLPAASVAVVVMLYEPAVRAGVIVPPARDHVPSPLFVAG